MEAYDNKSEGYNQSEKVRKEKNHTVKWIKINKRLNPFFSKSTYNSIRYWTYNRKLVSYPITCIFAAI